MVRWCVCTSKLVAPPEKADWLHRTVGLAWFPPPRYQEGLKGGLERQSEKADNTKLNYCDGNKMAVFRAIHLCRMDGDHIRGTQRQ